MSNPFFVTLAIVVFAIPGGSILVLLWMLLKGRVPPAARQRPSRSREWLRERVPTPPRYWRDV
jgi:hypothetical protein